MGNKFFKTIDEDLFKKLDINLNKEYFYYFENNKYKLEEVELPNSSLKNFFQLEDDEHYWNYNEQSIFMDLTLELKNIDMLFNNICEKKAIIGLGLEWKPKNSRLKSYKKIGSLDYNDKNKSFYVQNIDINDVNSNVEFKLVFYIEKAAEKSTNIIIGNKVGLILGTIKLWTIVVEGNGSIFPIFDEDKPNEPLWRIFISDGIDIIEDQFNEDNLSILLNKAHPSYKYLSINNESYSKPFFNECIAGALTNLILELREKNQGQFDVNKDYSQDTIIKVLQYFNKTLNFKINDSVSELSNSIKKFFDKE